MGLHIFPSGNSQPQTRYVCVGGVLFQTIWIGAFVFKYEGVDRGVGLPLPPIAFLFGAARAKFFFFPGPQIFTFSPSFYFRTLFSLLPFRLLPLTLSAHQISCDCRWVEDEGCKMAGGDCRCFALHSTEGWGGNAWNRDTGLTKENWIWRGRGLELIVYWVYCFFTSLATIFQSYMWRHRCAGELKKKLYLRSGFQHHRHFAWLFNVPVLHRHGTTLFIRWFRHTAPLSRILRHAGDTEDVFST